MAQYSRIEVIQQVFKSKMIPLFYNSNIEVGKSILKACYEGGARLVEFTARGDFAHQVFEMLVKYSIQELPDMIIGVGSVTDAEMASNYIQRGANFIVSASLREDIAPVCNRKKIAYMPGCGTLTEIGRAEELGCEIVKLFPGSVYGPDFVKSILGPQPWTSIMVTGGVSTEKVNLEKWFNSGICAVGLGSKLITKELIASGNFDLLKNETSRVLKVIESIKK